MSADPVDLPIPPELALDAPPITDYDLDRFTDWAVEQATAMAVDVDVLGRSPVMDDLTGTESDPDHLDPAIPDAVGRWRITDDGAAEWAIRHVAAVDVDLESLAEQTAAWHRRIQAWFDHATAPLVAKRAFFAAHLERYALELRAEMGTKTLNLPSGKVSTRVTHARPEVVDEATVEAWARATLPEEAQAEVLKVTTKVLVGELRNHLDLTEVPREVVLAPCGCVGTLPHYTDLKKTLAAFMATWGVGSAVECPSCGDEALVGQWTDTYRVVTGPGGELVAGMAVAPESVSAKVVPT